MGAILLKAIEKWFGEVQVIKGVDLSINDGEFVVFVGPSGCGKSTLLRMIGGLEDISRGSLSIDGQDVSDQPPAQRGLSMVFQSYALYPHMSVRDNMGFSLKTAGAPQSVIDDKVNAVAQTLKLTDFLGRRPKELSGGQRQRVAIGRSIVREPTAFLFDEPLSNLDAALRVEMRHEISKLHKALATTMIYVTHDQVEAMTLADRIVVLDAGLVVQVGTPRELYQQPSNTFVAQFIGSPKMNIVSCKIIDGAYHLANGRAQPCSLADGSVSQLGIRAEHIILVGKGEGVCDGTIDVLEYLGADTYIVLDCLDAGRLSVRLAGDADLALGTVVGVRFEPEHVRFFDVEGNAVREK